MFKYLGRLMVVSLALFVLGVACSSPAEPTVVIQPSPTLASETPTRPATLAASLPATPTRAQTVAPPATPTQSGPPTPGAKENLQSAFAAALPKIKAYRAKVVLDISRQDSPERIIEVILPDRFRQIQDRDIRQIGNKVYVLDPGLMVGTFPGLWYFFERVHLPWYRDQITQAKQVTFLGRSVIDGAQLVGYQSTVKLQGTNISSGSGPQQITEQPIKVWFSAQTGFPVRMEVGQPLLYINLYYDFNGKIDEIGPP